MAEFDLIERYFNFSSVSPERKNSPELTNSPEPSEQNDDSTSKQNNKKPRVIKGIGDDCAIFDIPEKYHLVTSTDTLVDGVHFFSDLSPDSIAHKALAANVSDLAAMGAKPLAFTLSISLPDFNESWLEGFSRGLKQASKQFKVPLVGGDTTQGPLNINITAYGTVKKGRVLKSDNAKVGDDIWVTGYLGEAAAALELHKKYQCNQSFSDAESSLWTALTKPAPPLKFANKLSKISNCGLDISDGLMADLGHILKQSDCGALIDVGSLPLSESLIEVVGIEQARQYALNGGDDYQLCFTANSKVRNKILNVAERFSVPVTRLGQIIDSGLRVELDKKPYKTDRTSWQHFSE